MGVAMGVLAPLFRSPVGKFGTELALGRVDLEGEAGADSTDSIEAGVAKFRGVLNPSTSPMEYIEVFASSVVSCKLKSPPIRSLDWDIEGINKLTSI